MTLLPNVEGDATRVMRVSELVVYPLKSARGIALEEATVELRGIAHDRRFMLVSPSGRFISQREHPRLALLETALTADSLVLTAAGQGGVAVPLAPSGALRRARVWQDDVDVIGLGAEPDDFLSTFLHAPVSLVHLPEASRRAIDPAFAEPGELVSLADGFPLLLLGQGSLDALNARLEVPVPMTRFRPNVVVTGAAPHAEDTWTSVSLGSLRVRVVKPCARCAIPTVDQTTAEVGVEPLRTLAGYRKQGGQVMFGQNAIPTRAGTLRVGDPVVVSG